MTLVEKKARQLLFAHLTKRERWRYRLFGTVVLKKGDRVYKIHKWRRTRLRYKGEPIMLGCLRVFHNGDKVPSDDEVLSKMLLIKGAEQLFLNTNIWLYD